MYAKKNCSQTFEIGDGKEKNRKKKIVDCTQKARKKEKNPFPFNLAKKKHRGRIDRTSFTNFFFTCLASQSKIPSLFFSINAKFGSAYLEPRYTVVIKSVLLGGGDPNDLSFSPSSSFSDAHETGCLIVL